MKGHSEKHDDLGITVKSRIVEGSELGHAIGCASHFSVNDIESPGQEDDCSGRNNLAGREQDSAANGENESDGGKKVGIELQPDKKINNRRDEP